MRFCPQCGAPLMAGAKFCIECGRALNAAASPAGADDDAPVTRRRDAAARSVPISFMVVFVAITAVGIAAAGWIILTPIRDKVAEAPAPAPSIAANAASPAPAAGPPTATADQAAAANPAAVANPAAGGNQTGDLPAGHPRIELPTEARTFIDKVEKEARDKPKDLAAWNKLGAVSMRAAMFDQSYTAKAEEAYAHVLKADPDNLDALRGIGDIDYDRQHYDEAIAAYEHYLKKKPDDAEVRTDLGTMYLYTGNADQAVVQYKKAIAGKPDFFQAYYNMGIAYAQQNKTPDAVVALNKADKLAPDDTARNQVKELIAKVTGQTPPAPMGQVAANTTASASAAPPAAASSSANASASAAAPAASPASSASSGSKDFHGEIERMVRGLPVAGPKVGSVQWPSQLTAKVMMDNFPMDQMPPFAKTKFLTDLKTGIDTAKKDNQISAPVQLDIVDAKSGRVMQTITQ